MADDTLVASHQISDEELQSIHTALISRYGMDFTNYEPSSLKRRIARVMNKNGFKNIIELWQRLLYDKEFVLHFKDELSVGLTEMFRNPAVWTYMGQYLRNLFDTQANCTIWHAGCSTGEEYYSMCIVLAEQGLTGKTELLVTDISDRFLAQAQKGCYETELIEKYALNYHVYSQKENLHHFFDSKDPEHLCFKKLYCPRTEFMHHNLATMDMNRTFDVIFCRNVMIYFNDTLKMHALKLFHQCLKPGGLLVIGHFDGMPPGYETYFEYHDPTLKIFRKKKS